MELASGTARVVAGSAITTLVREVAQEVPPLREGHRQP